MSAKDLHRMNDALDEGLERIARKAIGEGLVERRDGDVFFEGEKLRLYAPMFHRLLDEQEATDWERLQEKL